jgi:hypothetical protein
VYYTLTQEIRELMRGVIASSLSLSALLLIVGWVGKDAVFSDSPSVVQHKLTQTLDETAATVSKGADATTVPKGADEVMSPRLNRHFATDSRPIH